MTLYGGDVIRGAVIDPTGRYRWTLTRRWGNEGPRVVFILLNPSTADGDVDDPTIRRCMTFARRWGFEALEVVNLFGFRATDPSALETAEDPVGEWNDIYVLRACSGAGKVVVGWGKTKYRQRVTEVITYLAGVGVPLFSLGTTQSGDPRHPLYVLGSVLPSPWKGPHGR